MQRSVIAEIRSIGIAAASGILLLGASLLVLQGVASPRALLPAGASVLDLAISFDGDHSQ